MKQHSGRGGGQEIFAIQIAFHLTFALVILHHPISLHYGYKLVRQTFIGQQNMEEMELNHKWVLNGLVTDFFTKEAYK